ncbi:hypothetical protein GCM10011390_32660 [Aureimonas endophytica]|uniref:Glycosyltransferase 2-like domain-containing protein n=1 Tax=Aureimonas endophytica TaxID=2027858 RepID=A0A916ZSP7_9HYPH|nr:glycosyltransferase family A protein [Aureimonas endophytica]GGE11076.1 hypothetical protein GCM10011390_32660 [Aureimonas endophytica]
MRASVIVRSKDEADRLRLVLVSLAGQSVPAEIVVVNDGSRDHTRAVLAEADPGLDLVALHHEAPEGRSSAANAGAARASGDILIFLDGDTLAAPDFVERHLHCHRDARAVVARGETYHIRGTRPFLDPERGTPMPGQEAKVAGLSEAERARSLVSARQVRDEFPALERRAQPGIYPGFGPRRLFELEMAALGEAPDCEVLWAAASGSNQSVPRAAFLAVGGFHPEISINEHRELALKLCRQGLRMVPSAARSYHLIHRSGWRDPLADPDWARIFYEAHPLPAVALLPLLWESLGEAPDLPVAARLVSLPALAAAARPLAGISGREAVRAAHLARMGEGAHV